MPIQDRLPDDALDMTHSELKEYDEFDYDEEMQTEEEFREHVGEMHRAFEVYAASILLARMFDDEHLTLGEYLDLIDVVGEYESEMDATMM